MSSMLSPQPIPGLQIKPSAITQQPGQVIIGYERCRYPADCCNCTGLSDTAVIWIVALGILGIFFLIPFCFMWIPLVVDDCRKEYQRPVYGYPAQPQMGQPQVAQVSPVPAPAPALLYDRPPQYEAAVAPTAPNKF
eukprot:TRINITY_DN2589_c1_g2_i1.p2 TRINITY_DN2589_c1_g2~~TRINITY_DN2589_c1_g2_i1.p2  ORF type:complete len:136 (-),score=3.17 TRINITY_DN2589_c1_g2_i1:455-862(-)